MAPRYYLGPWFWHRKPLPSWGTPAGALASVDLGTAAHLGSKAGSPRPVGVFLAAGKLPSEYVALDDSSLSRSAWESLTGYSPSGDGPASWLWDHLTAGADPEGGETCFPLTPTHRGHLELHLGGCLRREVFAWGRHPHTNKLRDILRRDFDKHWHANPDTARRVLDVWAQRHGCSWREFVPPRLLPHVSGPLPHATIYTDDFSTALGTRWADKGNGDTWTISSNQLLLATPTSAHANSVLIYNSDLSSSDNSCQLTFVNADAVKDAGCCTRHNNLSAGSSNFYLFIAQGFASRTAMYKFVSDNYTQIGSTAAAASAGDVLYGESNGSTQTFKQNGSQILQTTDTTLTVGVRVGVRGGTGGSSANVLWDDFTGADLGGGTITITEQNLPSNHLGNITVHAVGSGTSWSSSTTWTASGVPGWSVASKTFVDATHYTITLTPPTAATPPAGATGTLSLTEGVTGTGVGTTTVGTPTLARSPTSGNTGTMPTLTLTGTNTIWSSETAAGLFTVTGGTGASLATPTVTSNTAATDVLTVGSTAGALTLTDTSTGATTTFTANTPPVTILVTDSNLYFSQGNWVKSGSTYAETNCLGAYTKKKFTGSTYLKLNVDVSPQTGASLGAAAYPAIAYIIDDGPWTLRQLLSTDTQITLATGLSTGTHTARVAFCWTSNGNILWAAGGSGFLRITGFELSGGGSLLAPDLYPYFAIYFCDSNGGGYEVNGAGVSFANTDATKAFPALMGPNFRCEFCAVPFAGTGYHTLSGTGGELPSLLNSWDLNYAGHSRLSGGLFSPAPDFIFCHHGQNDGGSVQADVTSLAASWRTAAPSAKLFFCSTSNLSHESEIVAGVAAAGDSAAFHAATGEVLYNGAGGVQAWSNSNHLSERGQTRYSGLLTQDAQRQMVTTVTGGGFF